MVMPVGDLLGDLIVGAVAIKMIDSADNHHSNNNNNNQESATGTTKEKEDYDYNHNNKRNYY